MEAASRLNIPVRILDVAGCPASQITAQTNLVEGSFKDPQMIERLARECDVLTIEIEHVDALGLQRASEVTGVSVEPLPSTLLIIQDKYKQKKHLCDVPMGSFMDVKKGMELEAIKEAASQFGYPMMLKAKNNAYDGKGNYVISDESHIKQAIDALSPTGGDSGLYVEKWVPFDRELAVMVARRVDGTIECYPCVETIQSNNICHLVIAPAQVEPSVSQKAVEVARRVVEQLPGAGIYGVELFLSQGDILFNEVAPRPHNSGHYTIEACHTSQFEQHLRCVLGWPLGSTRLKVGCSVMLNIVADSHSAVEKLTMASLSVPGATVHMYGKKDVRKGRKMGHITLVGDNIHQVLRNTQSIMDAAGNDAIAPIIPPPVPLVGIIMGSDSDLPIMKAAATTLQSFHVAFEVTIVSAHRTPLRMVQYAEQAHSRGIKVIIAGAGGAAHLPGMVAAITPLPVIGVPIALKVLDGVDSLHSIVQMPRGVPVATVAINNATNAALLAVRMLGTYIPSCLEQVQDFRRLQEEEVMKKVERLESIGWKEYN